MTAIDRALYQSLVRGTLLVGDLPEAARFAHEELSISESAGPLNLEQKLGHLYEDALAVLLESSARWGLLAKNLQVRVDQRTTVGELDFLLRDHESGQVVHLELATKFYLAVENADGLALPGPDARDNYFKKLQRLRKHQLVLAQRHGDALPEKFRLESIVTRQLIYGCLFDHVDASEQAMPEFINPLCRRGRWLSIDECATRFSSDTKFQVIPKALWPVPLELLDGITLETWSAPAQLDRCVMLRVDGEVIPYFIAPSGYPQHAATVR